MTEDITPTGAPDEPAVTEPDRTWERRCSGCGTELAQAVVDLDPSNADRPELRPGEMVGVDYCPNPDCPENKPEGFRDGPSAPGATSA
ncbi:MAG TPA: hypothetical protein VFV40_10480 [Nocardioides sp.]|nr:hypothetical protein [Nocardioides sp.]